MTRRTLTVALIVCAASSSTYLVLDAREQARAGAAAGRLTIDKLIDIEHPSAPVWSRDSRRIAFMSERAGVANLYVVPADGSAKPAALTVDAGGVTGVFWSADSQTVYFMRGGQLMQASADGKEMAKPALPQGQLRGLTPSPDGTRLAYLVGGAGGGGGGGRGRGGAGAAPATPPAAPPAPAGPTEIHVRSLQDGSDKTIASFTGPVGAVTWMADGERLMFTSGGGGQTIRHEQTPAYSGTKIIYTVNENVPGPPADVYLLPASGGTPVKVNTSAGGGGGRGGTRWVDDVHVLLDRQADFKRRSIFLVDTKTGTQTLLQEEAKPTFWSIPGGAGAGSQASPNGKWVSFLSDRDGWDQLYVVPVPAASASNGNGTSAASVAVQITKGPFETWRPSLVARQHTHRLRFERRHESGHAPHRHRDHRRFWPRDDPDVDQRPRHQHGAAVVPGRQEARLSTHGPAELGGSVRHRRGDAECQARPADGVAAGGCRQELVRRTAAHPLRRRRRQARAGVSLRAEDARIAP